MTSYAFNGASRESKNNMRRKVGLTSLFALTKKVSFIKIGAE
ncbi:hypothetical protein HMPREF9182_0763 [Streptococcus sp. oral taxon 056 str. F0418]|nr:hypothetical protein HMPREF9182_0763 [Streptococcus sp. oral taxon 056 str. F0418]